MNIFRNILTAVWCALIAGFYGFLTLKAVSMGGTQGAVVVALAIPAVFAILGLVYVPALTVSAIAQVAYLLVIGFFVPKLMSTDFGVVYTLITFVVAIVSAALVVWDLLYRRSQKSALASAAEEF